MTKITLSLGERGYDINIGKGILENAREIMGISGKVFIITDSGVPSAYSQTVKSQFNDALIYTVGEGESSKSISVLEEVLCAMLDFGMSRSDSVVAVGGGVVGDLAGFAASVYMRGISFYNIPTTMLSDVDSSIGGKTAVNLSNVKNIVGAFYQPRGVLIDTNSLKTLSERHMSAGLCEALKMALTSDAELFSIFEKENLTEEAIEKIIIRALMIKKRVVEEDERESGLRKILNFGHTFGHGIESSEELSGLYHGECVALGMIPMCSDKVRKKLIPILKKLKLPVKYEGDTKKALGYVIHDKKCKGGIVEAVFVDEVGSFRIEKLKISDFTKLIKERLNLL